MKQFMQATYFNDWNLDKQLEMELAAATASILPENGDDRTVKPLTRLPNIPFPNLFGLQRVEFVKTVNGLKPQNIEVEYVNIINVTNGLEGRPSAFGSVPLQKALISDG